MPYSRPSLSKLRDVNVTSREDGDLIGWDAESGFHVYKSLTPADIGAAAASHTHEQSDINGLADALGAKAAASDLTAHTGATGNPHSVTKSQVGLGNVSNDAQLKMASNLSDLADAATARSNLSLGDLATLNAVTKSLVSDLETITATPAASAVPKANGSGKIDPAWVDMLSGITLGTSAASRAVTANADNAVGIGTAPDANFRFTATSIKSANTVQTPILYVTGGMSIGDPQVPISGGLLFARAGAAEPFIRLACNGGATGIAQIRGRVSGGLKFTQHDGTTLLMEIGATGDTIVYGSRFAIRNSNTPASASATGNAGDICWDSNYLYVCVAANTWKRTALSSW